MNKSDSSSSSNISYISNIGNCCSHMNIIQYSNYSRGHIRDLDCQNRRRLLMMLKNLQQLCLRLPLVLHCPHMQMLSCVINNRIRNSNTSFSNQSSTISVI